MGGLGIINNIIFSILNVGYQDACISLVMIQLVALVHKALVNNDISFVSFMPLMFSHLR